MQFNSNFTTRAHTRALARLALDQAKAKASARLGARTLANFSGPPHRMPPGTVQLYGNWSECCYLGIEQPEAMPPPPGPWPTSALELVIPSLWLDARLEV